MSPRSIRQVATCAALLALAQLGWGADSAQTAIALAQTSAEQQSTPTVPAQPAHAPTPPAAQPTAGQPPQVATTPAPATPPVAAPTAAAQPDVGPRAAPLPVQLAAGTAATIAHSALLTVDGTATADALQLHIRRVSDKTLVTSDDVAVTVDGKSETVSRETGGAYEVPVEGLRAGDRHDVGKDVEIIVGHDGIREILNAKVSVAAEATSASGLLRDHKQVGWWILNIVVVLIAAIAISRRK